MSSIINRFRGNNTGVVGTPVMASPAYGTSYVTEDQLALQQQQFTLQKGAVQVNEPATTTTLQPIVQQSIRQDRVVEVQPIIHRDIERPVVNHIERHITEAAPVSRAGAIQHGAIVEERYHNRVVNEIQPVIHREIAVPQVEQVQQHFVERVVATPQHTRQVVYEQIPAVQGQQYIQQGLGTQQYLQSGLVQRSLIAQQPLVGQTGFVGQQGIPLAYNPQNALLNQQPLIAPQTGLIGQQALITQQPFIGGQSLYGTGLNRGLEAPLAGGYGTGLPYGSGLGYGTGVSPYGLTKADQKEERNFERSLRRQEKHIEREQNQINKHQLRQYEQLQREQALLGRHQFYQAQHTGLGGSPILGQPGFGSRGLYAEPLIGQQYISQPIYGTGLGGQQFLNQGYGTGLGGQQLYGTGLGGQQLYGTGLGGQQFLNQPYGQQFGNGLVGQQFENGLAGQQFANNGLAGQQFGNNGLVGQQNQGLVGRVENDIREHELNRDINRENREINNQHNNQL